MLSIHISVFDIPLLVAAICDHLSPHDIWCCYRVNRSWGNIFGPHRYRDVRFVNLNSTQTWDILDNAYRIRNLEVDLGDAEYLLKSRCTQLKELSCVDFAYISWPLSPESQSWEILYDAVWTELDTSCNALSLISRNRGLEVLKIHHTVDGFFPVPFTLDVLQALSTHRSLRSISINLRFELLGIVAFLQHCPAHLEELEIYLDVYYESEAEARLELRRPTLLRRLILHGGLFSFAHDLLVPLLEKCPLLEELKSPRITVEAHRELVATTIKHCPNLLSFEHDSGYCVPIAVPLPLLKAYPHGLRKVSLNISSSHLGGHTTSPRTLVHALLAHCTDSLEVLSLRGMTDCWHVGIHTVLEQCPNLRELDIQCQTLALDDIARDVNLETIPAWATASIVQGLAEATTMLPWVCSKLESVTLFIEQSTHDNSTILAPQKPHQTVELTADATRRTAIQVGLLYNTLRSLKSLKKVSFVWDWSLLHAIRNVPLERACAYMEQVGLPRVNQMDMEWISIDWSTIADLRERDRLDRMCQVAGQRRHGFDCDNGYMQVVRHEFDSDLGREEEEWVLRRNQKKVSRTGKPHTRRSLRNCGEWFDTRAKE
ncbi:hypothetical protein EDD21DRAFT_131365 [Dissophora ornata]|nr:hypothetical protein EDD21DRAFT_131365 [Dissophora ornata]